MKTLIIAEHNNNILNDLTLSVASAATNFSEKFDVLVVGHDCKNVIEKCTKIKGCHRVYVAESKDYQYQLAENVSKLISELAKNYNYILVSHSTFGKNLLPRVAAQLNVMPISDVVEVIDNNTFIRNMYAGNIRATVKSNDPIILLSIRGTSFPKALQQDAVDFEYINNIFQNTLSEFLSIESPEVDRPDLTNAKIVISGGRALKSTENFKILEELADLLGGAIGATRAAVDAGYIANEFQVGQTGKVVAPDIYFAIGISGAIQHLAGIKDSKIIVAINTDSEAPIFQIADYGLVGDLFEVVPEIIKLIKK